MYIKYNEKLYRYLEDDNELLTYKEDKIDSNFEEDDRQMLDYLEQLIEI